MQAVLTASGDATLRVWSVKDGSCIRTFVGHGSSVLRARFCAMGTKVVSSGSDGLMKVWNFHTGHCLSTVEAHEGKAWALDIGGENKAFAVSGADDGSLVLWGDASKGQAATLRQEHEKNIQEHQVRIYFSEHVGDPQQSYKHSHTCCRCLRLHCWESSTSRQPSWLFGSRSQGSYFTLFVKPSPTTTDPQKPHLILR